MLCLCVALGQCWSLSVHCAVFVVGVCFPFCCYVLFKLVFVSCVLPSVQFLKRLHSGSELVQGFQGSG